MVYKFNSYEKNGTALELKRNDNVVNFALGHEKINISWNDLCDMRNLLDRFIHDTPLDINY